MIVTADCLPGLHTKVLLKALRQTRATTSYQAKLISDSLAIRGMTEAAVPVEQAALDAQQVVDAMWLGGSYGDSSTVTVEQLKAELSKREHVPNKQESIELRKAKQARKRQKGRRDR